MRTSIQEFGEKEAELEAKLIDAGAQTLKQKEQVRKYKNLNIKLDKIPFEKNQKIVKLKAFANNLKLNSKNMFRKPKNL